MATTDIDLSGFRGAANFAFDGTATTNSISGTFNFTNAKINRPHDGKCEFSADFVSDGQVTLNGMTNGTNGADIAGFGGGVVMTQGTATTPLFRANFDSWSATINSGTVEYGTFASRWKNSKLTTGNMTGSCTGVVRDGYTLPKSSS
jgi:hypothetical protein